MIISKRAFIRCTKELLTKVGGNLYQGIVFNGNYMSAMSDNGYWRVKLPEYIPDSFVLPTKVLKQIMELIKLYPVKAHKIDMITIKRSEKYMDIEMNGLHYVYSFVKDTDMDTDIDDYWNENQHQHQKIVRTI